MNVLYIVSKFFYFYIIQKSHFFHYLFVFFFLCRIDLIFSDHIPELVFDKKFSSCNTRYFNEFTLALHFQILT